MMEPNERLGILEERVGHLQSEASYQRESDAAVTTAIKRIDIALERLIIAAEDNKATNDRVAQLTERVRTIEHKLARYAGMCLVAAGVISMFSTEIKALI